MLTTADFPQADRLKQVGDVAVAVANDRHTDDEIENFIGLHSEGRQGRYYRRAAEILGLITTERNYSETTPLGAEYATLQSEQARIDFLGQCLLENTIFREALLYIKQHNPTDDQLKHWFYNIYPGAQGTANRRFSTFLNYLKEAKLVDKAASANRVRKFAGAVVKQTKKLEEGIPGKPVERILKTLSTTAEGKTIQVMVDAEKRERANQIHWNLVTAKAAFLDSRGIPAIQNGLIDLFSKSNNETILYEMKSISQTNFIHQVRKAVAQLYEYRYIFSAPGAKLCIVTNAPMPKDGIWVSDYLTGDRSIAYEWTEDYQSFQCNDKSSRILERFAP